MLTSLVMAAMSLWALAIQAPVLDSTERARAKQMLNEIKSAIRSNYIPAPADLGEGRDRCWHALSNS
jgi:hypothetical protein